MVAWLKQPHCELSFKELFLEIHTTKASEVQNIGSPKRYKWASKIKTSLIPPIIIYSNWITCLGSPLWTNTSSLNTQPNPALTQPTSPLIRDPPFDKSNFICPMVASPNLKPTMHYCCHIFHGLWYHASPTLLLHYNHWAHQTTRFRLQTVDILKPTALILAPGALHVPNHVPTLN